MTQALVVYCHPDDHSFVRALKDRVTTTLAAQGADVRVEDLYADGFEPTFTADDHARHLEPGIDPSLQAYADDLLWCDTLVFVYPTWWSGQPAMLKGWIDRVWVDGVAWSMPPGADRIERRLTNVRRLVAITTHGSSKWVNAIEGESGKRTITRSLRSMCHPLARTTWIAMYGVDVSSPQQRARYLERVERRVARFARN